MQRRQGHKNALLQYADSEHQFHLAAEVEQHAELRN